MHVQGHRITHTHPIHINFENNTLLTHKTPKQSKHTLKTTKDNIVEMLKSAHFGLCTIFNNPLLNIQESGMVI